MKIENLLEKPIWQMTGQEFLALNEQGRSTIHDQQIVSISENYLSKMQIEAMYTVAR